MSADGYIDIGHPLAGVVTLRCYSCSKLIHPGLLVDHVECTRSDIEASKFMLPYEIDIEGER